MLPLNIGEFDDVLLYSSEGSDIPSVDVFHTELLIMLADLFSLVEAQLVQNL